MNLTKRILERVNYSVHCAAGYEDARKRLADFTPDGIILENDPPDDNGLNFCRELRSKSAVPIMFISNDKEDELAALQAGANDYLKKPYENNILAARIGVMLNAGVLLPQRNEDLDTSALGNAQQEQRLVQPNAADEYIKKKWSPKAGRVYMSVAACLMVVLIGTGVYVNFNGRLPEETVFIPDDPIPLSSFSFRLEENVKPYEGTERGVTIPDISNIIIPADKTDVSVLLFNPEDNRCYLTFEIVLVETGESLYKSGMVEPGMCVEEITLSRGLEKGGHKAGVKVLAYDTENFAFISGINMDVYITAE